MDTWADTPMVNLVVRWSLTLLSWHHYPHRSRKAFCPKNRKPTWLSWSCHNTDMFPFMLYAYRDLRTTYTQRRLTYFCISSGLNPPMPKSFSYTINFLGTSVSNPFPIPIIIPALFLRLPVIIALCLIQFLGFKHLPHPASSPRPTILTCTNPPP